MNVKFSRALKAVKAALFPADLTCDVCGRETFGSNICAECAAKLAVNDKNTCPVCGRKTARNEICAECKSVLPAFDRAVSAFVYTDGAVTLVKKFKEGGAYLKDYFADTVCEKLKNFPPFDCIVCVPMTRRAKRKRGYNQSELLAKAISERTGAPFINGALEKVKETPEQKRLSREERSKNLGGSFKVVRKAEIAGKRVLIADDVLTTGATSDELSKTLKKAGAEKVYLATVASVEYNVAK